MENLTFFQYLLLVLIVGIGGSLFYIAKISIPAYFEEKAKNLAQSEDIEKLTALVKEVEYKFEERSQNLRAQLDLTNQFQLGLHNEERSALMNLHNFSIQYSNFITDVTFGGINLEEDSDIAKRLSERSQNSYIFISNLSNTILLLKDDIENDIVKSAQELHTSILAQSKTMIKYLSDIRILNNNRKVGPEGNNSYYEKRYRMHDEYQNATFNSLKEITQKTNILTKEAKKYLEARTKSNYKA